MAAKSVALLSGGLDSTLAIRVVQEQGIEVIGINFVTPFFSSAKAEQAAEKLDISLQVVDIFEEHLEVVKNPKYGYGKNMNPCIDCHALMVKKAGGIMKSLSASFIITGEVLGERPKSQNRQALRIVEKESGYEGYILRPLSARHLPETVPEQEKLVEREKLLDVKGRSRRPQLALAAKYGLEGLPTPAGGCLLTDTVFSQRLRDLFETRDHFALSDIELLKYGRHFRLAGGTRIVVARNEQENKVLEDLIQPGDLILQVKNHPGPRTIVRDKNYKDKKIVEDAALLTARYSKARSLPQVEVEHREFGQKEEETVRIKEPMRSFEARGGIFTLLRTCPPL